jgi:hypothetical protein
MESILILANPWVILRLASPLDDCNLMLTRSLLIDTSPPIL